MREFSNSYKRFLERLGEIDTLLSVLPTSGMISIDWRRSSAIIMSCIVLMCSHFEAYFEELVSEYIDFLNAKRVSISKIPSSIKAIQVKEEFDKIAEIKDWQKKVVRIERCFLTHHILWSKAHPSELNDKPIIEEFDNPGSKQIETLFSYLNVNSFFKQIAVRYKKPDLEEHFKQAINTLISLRNRISHGEPSDCRQTKDDVLRHMKYLKALALATDKLIGSELQNISQIKPWDTSFKGRRRSMKELGFSP
jgi:hypothetical protein